MGRRNTRSRSSYTCPGCRFCSQDPINQSKSPVKVLIRAAARIDSRSEVLSDELIIRCCTDRLNRQDLSRLDVATNKGTCDTFLSLMSFDLYFCSQKNERVDFDAVWAWANRRGNFSRTDNQLWYENPNTGVYFSLDFDPQGSVPLDDSPIPSNYFDSGLSFNLNFNRPSFFGYEAMPYVEELANRFDLSVVDNQAEVGLMPQPDSKVLVESWLRHNGSAIHTVFENPPFSNPLRMPIASSLYLWKYSIVREDLERTCGEEIFVPHLFPVHRKGTSLVGRAVTCTQGVPMIVPEADWVFVVIRKKRIFRIREKHRIGVINIETFRELLRDNIKTFEWTPLQVGVIRPESCDKVGKILRSVEHILDSSELEVIRRDAFVDIQLPDGK
jgi:hypothetical protein